MKMRRHTASALALALALGPGFAGTASALTMRDFGPVGTSATEMVRLVVKSAPPPPAGVNGRNSCQGQFFVSLPGVAARNFAFTLAPGQARVFNIDPGLIGPPQQMFVGQSAAGMPPAPSAPAWELSVSLALGNSAGSIDTGRDLLCAKVVTASVQILDRATGEIRRADDSYVETP